MYKILLEIEEQSLEEIEMHLDKSRKIPIAKSQNGKSKIEEENEEFKFRPINPNIGSI